MSNAPSQITKLKADLKCRCSTPTWILSGQSFCNAPDAWSMLAQVSKRHRLWYSGKHSTMHNVSEDDQYFAYQSNHVLLTVKLCMLWYVTFPNSGFPLNLMFQTLSPCVSTYCCVLLRASCLTLKLLRFRCYRMQVEGKRKGWQLPGSKQTQDTWALPQSYLTTGMDNHHPSLTIL